MSFILDQIPPRNHRIWALNHTSRRNLFCNNPHSSRHLLDHVTVDTLDLDLFHEQLFFASKADYFFDFPLLIFLILQRVYGSSKSDYLVSPDEFVFYKLGIL